MPENKNNYSSLKFLSRSKSASPQDKGMSYNILRPPGRTKFIFHKNFVYTYSFANFNSCP